MEENNTFFRTYFQDIRFGEVYDTFIDGRDIGKSVYSGIFVRNKKGFERIVLLRKEEDIACYNFHDFFVNERGLVLKDATPFPLPDDAKGIADRLLKARGL